MMHFDKKMNDDNFNRCPWCGNIVKRSNRNNLFHSVRCCPFCNQHYCCKVNTPFFLFELIIVVFLGLFIKYYWALLIVILIDLVMIKLGINKSPLIRCYDTIMPEFGYRITIYDLSSEEKFQFKNDVIIPIVFVGNDDKPISSMCCVRISELRKANGEINCNLRFISHGVSPEATSSHIFLFNKGKAIGKGIIRESLEKSY